MLVRPVYLHEKNDHAQNNAHPTIVKKIIRSPHESSEKEQQQHLNLHKCNNEFKYMWCQISQSDFVHFCFPHSICEHGSKVRAVGCQNIAMKREMLFTNNDFNIRKISSLQQTAQIFREMRGLLRKLRGHQKYFVGWELQNKFWKGKCRKKRAFNRI
jgi:hypothetical protein